MSAVALDTFQLFLCLHSISVHPSSSRMQAHFLTKTENLKAPMASLLRGNALFTSLFCQVIRVLLVSSIHVLSSLSFFFLFDFYFIFLFLDRETSYCFAKCYNTCFDVILNKCTLSLCPCEVSLCVCVLCVCVHVCVCWNQFLPPHVGGMNEVYSQ